MKKAPLLAMLTAATLLCTGCLGAIHTGDAGQTPTSVPSASTVPPSLSANGGAQAQPQASPTVTNPAWRAGDEQAAKDVALKAMADFARPAADKTQWANDFARWLTPKATADCSDVDPANVPASRITGAVKLTVDQSNGFGATATVPTNIGPYTVQLLRASQEAPWKVNRLTPPD